MSTYYSVGARYKVDDTNQSATRVNTVKGQYRTYRVKAGDRIDTIAHQAFGDPNRWWEIADLNPQIKFPLDLVPGDVLRVPL